MILNQAWRLRCDHDLNGLHFDMLANCPLVSLPDAEELFGMEHNP
jgi:hypothetical protein